MVPVSCIPSPESPENRMTMSLRVLTAFCSSIVLVLHYYKVHQHRFDSCVVTLKETVRSTVSDQGRATCWHVVALIIWTKLSNNVHLNKLADLLQIL